MADPSMKQRSVASLSLGDVPLENFPHWEPALFNLSFMLQLRSYKEWMISDKEERLYFGHIE